MARSPESFAAATTIATAAPASRCCGAVFGVGFGIGATCLGITVAIATGAWWGGLVLVGDLWLRGRVDRRAGVVSPRPARRLRVP